MITLYTTHCPKCGVLEKKMTQNGIEFTSVDDVDLMLSMGLQDAPHLQVDDTIMDFKTALEWIKEHTT